MSGERCLSPWRVGHRGPVFCPSLHPHSPPAEGTAEGRSLSAALGRRDPGSTPFPESAAQTGAVGALALWPALGVRDAALRLDNISSCFSRREGVSRFLPAPVCLSDRCRSESAAFRALSRRSRVSDTLLLGNAVKIAGLFLTGTRADEKLDMLPRKRNEYTALWYHTLCRRPCIFYHQ